MKFVRRDDHRVPLLMGLVGGLAASMCFLFARGESVARCLPARDGHRMRLIGWRVAAALEKLVEIADSGGAGDCYRGEVAP